MADIIDLLHLYHRVPETSAIDVDLVGQGRPGRLREWIWADPDGSAPSGAFIAECIAHYCPKEYAELTISISSLPNHRSTAHDPFASLALNVNGFTRMHRDKGDFMCLVVPLGDSEGGDLCFKEYGIVLPLKAGDLVFFRSSDITHFNLHYCGKRASLVLHTDHAIVSGWNDKQNGWPEESLH
ncbi:unnamed protein product [Peniophora sp. CBMAI 1063]|nr:unnamed protein product [Peniophora sp. CBMAI 1063]